MHAGYRHDQHTTQDIMRSPLPLLPPTSLCHLCAGSCACGCVCGFSARRRQQWASEGNSELVRELDTAIHQYSSPSQPLGRQGRTAEFEVPNSEAGRVHQQIDQQQQQQQQQRQHPQRAPSVVSSQSEEFNPIQRSMLKECLRRDSRLLRQLDPSRESVSEETYTGWRA